MIKKLLESFGGALVALPALLLTAFSQLFMAPLAAAIKEGLYQIFGGLNNSAEENRINYVSRKLSQGEVTPALLREFVQFRKKENYMDGCKMAYENHIATYKESKDYLTWEMKYNPGLGITQEDIDKYLSDNYKEEGGNA